jgi:hypothetical protein
MNNNNFTPFRTPPLVRVWYSSGTLGSPLVCAWVDSASLQAQPKLDSSSAQEPERLPLCA